jgi:hypothetical protein
MYVNFQKKHATTCSVFCEPDVEIFLFPTGYDVCGALDLTKDSLYSIARPFLFF